MIFLNKQGLSKEFNEVYFDLSKVPVDTIKFDSDFVKSYDAYHFFDKGNLYDYIIEPFKKTQTKAYKELIDGKFFYAIKRTMEPADGDVTRFGVLINDRVYYIDYSEDNYAEDPDFFDFDNIPDFRGCTRLALC